MRTRRLWNTWKISVLALLALALVSAGQVRPTQGGNGPPNPAKSNADLTRLTGSIYTLNAKLTQLERHLAMMRRTISELEQRLAALEARVAALEEGKSAKAGPSSAKSQRRQTVYIKACDRNRRIGVIYHTLTCPRLVKDPRHIDWRRIMAVPLEEAKRKGYHPCRVCHPPQ